VAIALAALGVTLMVTNPWFTAVDDEIAIVDVAANPAWQTIKLFLSGGGQHEHPPLSDLILHGWLWLTNGNSQWFRLPSVIFYLLGIWFLVQAARRIGGNRAGYGTLLLLIFWPYGFHFGRLTGWYSFTFMLVSLLTLIYLRYLEDTSWKTWLWLGLCALALIYTNYFGWAMLSFLGLDYVTRFRRDAKKWMLLLSTLAVLLLACVPILPAFLTEAHARAKTAFSPTVVATGIYNFVLSLRQRIGGAVVLGVGDRGGFSDCLRPGSLVRRTAGTPLPAVFCGAAGGDDFSADWKHEAHVDDQPLAGSAVGSGDWTGGATLGATMAGDFTRGGGRHRLVRNFFAESVRRAALDRALEPGFGARRGDREQRRRGPR